jgi:hypothetical protein
MTGEKRVKMLGGSDGERKLHDTWSTAKFVVADVALMTGTLVVRLFIGTQNRLVALHSALFPRLT